jgi:2-polyprenyl-3-methyl-5-hydroxy-6-metoxy-1,4-benzoquinol methylase
MATDRVMENGHPASPGPQVEPEHYGGLEYDSRHRFASYWYQIDAVLRYRPVTVLEIGIGSGVVSQYLRSRGLTVTTLDLESRLRPSVAGDVARLPFRDRSFDLVLCCQVLEHVPLATAQRALAELRRVTRGHIVISVPDITPCVRLLIPFPGREELRWLITRRWKRRRRLPNNPHQHAWELGIRDCPAARFRTLLAETGLELLDDYRIFENPYHHFFELRA